MKILVYSYRADETTFIEKFSKQYQIEVKLCKEAPSIENAQLAAGFECISVITTPINEQLLEKFYQVGVRFISTRTIGYDHIDVKKAKALGIHIGNVTYSPNSVADYTVMLILMTIRKMKAIMDRSSVQDYSLKALQGREVHNLTLGVIGTGKIGQRVIKHLSGFDCELLAYDLYENEQVKQYAKYVTLETLLRNSDVITLHMPSTQDNYHIINKSSIDQMKQDVFIINTARGSLIDTDDLIDAIECKKVAGAALDVIENESAIYYKDFKNEIISNRQLAILKAFPNVILTPHTAFYTDQAVSDMVENSFLSCILFTEHKENPWQVV